MSIKLILRDFFNGSNLLISDKGYYGVIILIHENNFSNIKVIKKNENIY